MGKNLTRRTFTTDSTWTAPAGVTRVKVITKTDVECFRNTGGAGLHAIDNKFFVWAIGSNTGGQLGDGTTVSRSFPVLNAIVDNKRYFSGAVQTASGGGFGAYLGWDGMFYTMGNNASGQLGSGSVSATSIPTVFGGGLTPGIVFKKIDCGINTSYGIDVDGNIYSCGANTSGALGDNTTTSAKSTPVLVVGSKTWKWISAGDAHVAAIDTAGAGYGWGANSNGQIGDGTSANKSSPVAIQGGLTFSKIRAGTSHTLGVTTSGALYAWGLNSSGELGDGTVIPKSSPVLVQGGLSWIDAAATNAGSFGIASDGTIYSWGLNTSGQLGQNNSSVGAKISSPVAITGSFKFTKISRSTTNSIWALRDNGNVYCWGYNGLGWFGDLTIVDKSSPSIFGLKYVKEFPLATSDQVIEISVTPGTTYDVILNAFTARIGQTTVGTLADSIILEYEA
jgi:alpha-tubulin suppressor-like RCC1 family protein